MFINGKSQGLQKKVKSSYRFWWDQAVYEPGEVTVKTYKNNATWVESSIWTTGTADGLHLTVDRDVIRADGNDLSFITLEVIDGDGNVIRNAKEIITFSIRGPGDIVATDNGFEADFSPFPSNVRQAFNGMALAAIKSRKGKTGTVTVHAFSPGLLRGSVALNVQ